MNINFQTATPVITTEIQESLLLIQEATEYLRDTDWYVIRKLETGKPIPEDIEVKRSEARSKVIDI